MVIGSTMASESSSAVLELNDADADDTDAPSVADDAPEGAPLIMEHGLDIVVKVDAPLKQLSTLETFVTYRVRCACARWPAPPHVRRRYNHFKALHRRLCAAHEWQAVPPLPPLHSARQQLDRYSPAFVQTRTLALHAFLDRVARHPILTHSEHLRVFLTAPADQLEKVFKSESSALSLWGLSGALHGAGAGAGADSARVKDPEFAAAADYLHCLQHKLSALAALTSKLHQGSAAAATELLGMKRACDAWSCQARGAEGRAVRGAGAGAGGAHAALSRACVPPRARLPLLAAYAGVLHDKIRQRDALHAQVSEGAGAGGAEGDAQNRLAVASETLRSELAHWRAHTRADLAQELLALAAGQVRTLTQVVAGWELALELSAEALSADQLFKTVPRSAVRRAPAHTPAETERDFDDLDNYSDAEIQDIHSDTHTHEEDAPLTDARAEPRAHRETDESGGSRSEETSKAEVLTDPLQSFSEVDLSS